MQTHVSRTENPVPKVVGFVVLIAVGCGSIGFVAAGDRCVGCAPCENGRCAEDGEGFLASHHHCCARSCLAHSAIAVPLASAATAPPLAAAIHPGQEIAALDPAPDTPYRPPRA